MIVRLYKTQFPTQDEDELSALSVLSFRHTNVHMIKTIPFDTSGQIVFFQGNYVAVVCDWDAVKLFCFRKRRSFLIKQIVVIARSDELPHKAKVALFRKIINSPVIDISQFIKQGELEWSSFR